MVDKPFTTINDQIKILRSRGLAINETASRTLMLENYYSLINGYKDVFLSSTQPERYIDGTTFNDIASLFLFDRDLRLTFFPWIIQLEANLKSVVAHVSSGRYYPSPEFYLDPCVYDFSGVAANKSRGKHLKSLGRSMTMIAPV